MSNCGYVIVLIWIGYIKAAESLECYNCSNTNSVNDCASTIRCQSGQSCYLDLSNLGYSLGCIDNQRCGALPPDSSLVGRSIHLEQDLDVSVYEGNVYVARRDMTNRDTQRCFECCSSDICNRYLCGHLKPTACIDDPKIDCALINSKFNICQIVHEAKSICPRFCGLCSLVDGNWASWTAWSSCDVTCDEGIQIRSRQCVNPSPANGGLDCPGVAVENRTCNIRHCPVDGRWADWSSWSSCDVSCGNGTQTRARACTNPTPAYNGSNCSGVNMERKLCVQDFCQVHGGWTKWLPWEQCSVTCDIGIQRRHRNCTNPVPEHLGHYCFGDAMDVSLCQPGPCANGGWAAWGVWLQCDNSSLITSRTRTCTNPRPSALGRQCEGDSIQFSSCDNINDTILFHGVTAFTVDTPSSIRSSILTFSHSVFQQGTDYNIGTGVFTCSVPGTYLFSVNLVKKRTSGRVYDSVSCILKKNNIILATISINPNDDASADAGSAGVSSTVAIGLNKGDTVYLTDCTAPESMESRSVFSGVLLHL